MGDSSESRVGRGCAWVAAIATVGLVAASAYTYVQLEALAQPHTPDLAAKKVVDSAPVVTADRTATADVDVRLAEVTRAGAGTVPGPTAVLDACQTTPGSTVVTCSRSVFAYFAFDGDLEARMRAWAAALAAEGWTSQGDPFSRVFRYYATMTDQPHARGAFLATELPSSGSLCHSGGPAVQACLRFDWAERPWTSPLGSFKVGTGPYAAIRQQRLVDPTQAETAEFADHRYVAIVTLGETYFQPTAPPTPSPTSAVPSVYYTPCYSGNHCD